MPNYKEQFKQLTKVLYQLEQVKFDADIARALGVDKSNVTQILTGDRQISSKMVDRLIVAFPVLNDYKVDTDVKKGVNTSSVLTHNEERFNIPIGTVKRGDLPLYHFIPVIKQENLSGDMVQEFDLDKLREAEVIEFYYSIPDFNECQIIVTMVGDDMADKYQPSDKLLLELRPDKEEIVLGKAHLIVTKTMRIVRYVWPSEQKGYWILKAHNPKYPDMPLEKDRVGAIFQIKGHQNRN